nr:DUF6584 family protein [Cryptosporangium aurantiacum]
MATQRLRGLVGSFPLDLEIRAQLAEAYRAQGNAAQAGRWSYLAEHRDADEVAAFERATPDPLHRMRCLAWPADPGVARNPAAVERLNALRAAAEARHRMSIPYPELARGEVSEASRGEKVGCALAALAAGLFLLGVANGARTVVRWLF